MTQRHRPPPAAGEGTFLDTLLRQETVGGAVVLVAAVVAVTWANSPWSGAYDALRQLRLGPLDAEHWAADGALTLFFYLAGLEVKRELLVGSLRRPADALVPIVAAVTGVATPALVYTVINTTAGGRPEGWAVPAATDIAFALAVLSLVGSGLPAPLRAFLLTLAVVDDLVVIAIIAVLFTETVHLVWLAGALGALLVFWLLQRRRGESWAWYVPVALTAWWCVHESGVHATVAGVAMGLLTRVLPDPGEPRSPAEALEHALTPVSAAVAVPFFAFMSAGGAHLGDGTDLVRDPVLLGAVAGLLLGKPVGVLLGAWGTTALTPARLDPDLGWRDLLGVAVLAGVGFTVALLVADLSLAAPEAAAAKTGVLAGSVLAGLAGAVLLRRRTRARARG